MILSHPLSLPRRNNQYSKARLSMKTLLKHLILASLFVLPGAFAFAQDASPEAEQAAAVIEKPVLYVKVIESLPRFNEHSRFLMIDSAFSKVFEDQEWPISEVKVVRFGYDTPEDALELTVYVASWRYRMQSQIEFRCAAEFKHDGLKEELGMMVGYYTPRPITTANSQEEAYERAATNAAKRIVRKLNEVYFNTESPQ